MRLNGRLAAVTLAAVLASAGCASTHVHKAASPASTSASADPGQECRASGGMWSGAVCITPTPSPSDSAAGPIGTTFTVTSSDGTSYDVTLDKVIQHARLGPYDSLTNYQDHAAAARFTITGDTGQSGDDVNNDANVIGSDQVQYQSTSLTSLPNFSYGDFKVAPGQTVKGWVTFELPPGTTIAQIQWAPGGIDSQAATWTVTG